MMSNPFSLKALSKASFTLHSGFSPLSFTFPVKLLSWWRKTSVEGTLWSRRRVHFSLIIARNSSPMCFCYFWCVLGVYKITSSMKLKKKELRLIGKVLVAAFDGSKTRAALSKRIMVVAATVVEILWRFLKKKMNKATFASFRCL